MPKPSHTEFIARGLLVEHDHVLLCQNTKHGYLYLPGGHVEFNEPAGVALARELIEEAGLPVTVGPLLLAHEASFTAGGRLHHELNLVFQMARARTRRQRGGPSVPRGTPAPVESLEPGIAFAWIPAPRLARVDLRPASLSAWLRRHLRRPAAATLITDLAE